MVEDRITDGERIAQLLSSELSGRETGPLAAVAVADADPDAEPDPEGTVAYAVTHREERIGEVSMYPDAVELALSLDPERVAEGVLGDDLAVDRSAGAATIRIRSGAAVKRAVDALVAGLPDGE